ncbi:hypothetical protein ACWCP6_10350 [Streptomyces sp. NPDC002004]
MARTEHGTERHVLHRELAGTIGLLVDEEDFTAMRRYRTFTFDDHTVYLRQAESLLKTRAAQGRHTSVALFDPEEYAEYCAHTGLDADAPISRSRYTAELAAVGPTLPYEGQPLAHLLPDLVDEAVRQATWQYATTLLADVGDCAVCGEDIGRAAFTRASHLLARILETAAPGAHHLVCNVSAHPESLSAALTAESDARRVTQLDETEALEFATVLAVGLATRSPGGLVMRTSVQGADDRVCGWRLRGDTLQPLTAAEVFDAYCTDVDTGDLIAPEPGVDYGPPPDLGPEPPAARHDH